MRVLSCYGGKALGRAGRLFEMRAKASVTNRATPGLHGQVVVRITDGKIITRGPITLSMDFELRSAIEKYGVEYTTRGDRVSREARPNSPAPGRTSVGPGPVGGRGRRWP